MQNRKLLAIFAAMFAALLVLAGPAALAGGGDKDGDADSDSSTAYTEDNDTNDGGTPNNQPDEGDNEHPSGKDKSVEHGNSGNQGKSESNPDDSKGPMRYEGELGDDKPNGPGGTDLADQDGNNGCGNDDDFDDDNNGWCGKPKDTEGGGGENPCVDDTNTPEDECDEGEGGGGDCVDDMSTPEDECGEGEGGGNTGGGGEDTPGDVVLGETISRPATDVPGGDVVLGTGQERGGVAAATAALPFTGAALIPFVAMGFGLIGSGTALVRKRNR